jgi:hypothetical protein
VKRYFDIITEKLKETQSPVVERGNRGIGAEDEATGSDGLILSNSFQRRPIPMSAFLQQHRLQQQLDEEGGEGRTTIPGFASDPRSLINYRNLMQSSTRGVLRQVDDSSAETAQNDEENNSSAESSQLDHDESDGGYRVMTNPSMRFYSTRPRVIHLHSSSQDNQSSTNSVRIISYPRSGSQGRPSETMQPVTYILRRVPSANGSGYIPVAFRHRILATGHSDDEIDSDDGL